MPSYILNGASLGCGDAKVLVGVGKGTVMEIR